MGTETSAVAGLGGASIGDTPTKQVLGKDDFLKLFMAQLAYQDPTAPTDSSQFVTQLAQFSNVELLQSANSRLDSLLLAQASSNATNAASLAGRNVRYASDTAVLKDGAATLRADLAGDAATVTWTITDANGKTVRKLQGGNGKAGALEATWDGRDEYGNVLPAGDYHVSVVAADQTGKAVSVDTRGSGRVDAVNFTAGYPQLVIGGHTVRMSDVTEVAAP